jgi:hypothetical protein
MTIADVQPIPLELLVLITPDEHYNSAKLSATRTKLMPRPSGSKSTTASGHVPPKPESKHGFSMTIVHLGKKGYSMQLWVDTFVSRKKWLESMDKQQQVIRDRSCVFVSETITEGYFTLGQRKINCISPYGESAGGVRHKLTSWLYRWRQANDLRCCRWRLLFQSP